MLSISMDLRRCSCMICHHTHPFYFPSLGQGFSWNVHGNCNRVLYILKQHVCLSVRPGLETHIPKKTHTFSFQVSRNEGSVCLGTWGRGRVGAGQGWGRAGLGQGWVGQGRAGQTPARCFQLQTGQGGQGRAGQAIFNFWLQF